MRVAFAVVVATGLVTLCAADPARASIRRHTEIPAQQLGTALAAFAKDRNLQIVYLSDAVDTKRTNGAVGELTADEALSSLLSGTGLTYRFLDETTVTVAPQGAVPRRADQSSSGAPVPDSTARENSTDGQREGPPRERFRVAQLDQARATGIESSAEATKNGAVELQEVVVSAQKRDERLRDVPVPVTSIGAAALVNNNQLRLQDYYASVPALGMTVNYNGAPSLTIRGLSTGNQTNPTVGVIVDDVPFGSSTALGGGFFVPDVDPSELARVEVLRGPQGTLYGANSIGGLIKYVTEDPSTDGLNARLQAGVSGVRNGDGAGSSLRGAVNVPIGDTLAVRASAFGRKDPGFIDDPRLGIRGVNDATVYGGRLSALWKASDNVSLRLSALRQDYKTDGAADVDVLPGLDDLQQDRPKGTGERHRTIDSYRASITATLGSLELAVISGYSIGKDTGNTDLTAVGFLTDVGAGLYGTDAVAIFDDIKTNKFTQEIRLSGTLGPKADWMAGLYYTHEKSDYQQTLQALDFASGDIAGVVDQLAPKSTFKEYAAFADLTVHFTERLDVQFGGRESKVRQGFSTLISGPGADQVFGLAPPIVPPDVHTDESVFTYLVTPRLRLSSEVMLYARFASGYRPGGPNTNTTLAVLPTFSSDRTENYEVGLKGDVLNNRLSIDASVYYIDWKDIQIQLFDPNTSVAFFANGGKAKSQGVELSAQLRPVTDLSLETWAAWNDAELKEAFSGDSYAVGAAGDRLPYSARFSGGLSARNDFHLPSGLTLSLGGSLSYMGARKGIFSNIFAGPDFMRQTFPAYAQLDLRMGFSRESWSANVFVNNVADRRGVLSGGIDNINPVSFNYIQPRTFGLSVARSFFSRD